MTVISRAPKLAFVQSQPHRYGWHDHPYLSDSCKAAAVALKALGYKVNTFTRTKLPAQHMVTPHTPVKGDTGCVKYLYERAFPGVTYPNFDVPKELTQFARRKFKYSTLGELRAQHRAHPFSYDEKFVKPTYQAKLFYGHSAQYAAGYALDRLPDNTPITVQDFRDFQDEVRFFVAPWTGPITVDGYADEMDQEELANLKKITEYANTIYETWKPTGPKCYVMDVGLSSKPRANRYYPTLVEINSVFTCGNLEEVKPNTSHPGRLVATGWKSYARYAERGEF